LDISGWIICVHRAKKNSKEAVKLALALNNVSIIGQKLKVGKPKFKKEEPKSKNNNDPETLNSSSIISL